MIQHELRELESMEESDAKTIVSQLEKNRQRLKEVYYDEKEDKECIEKYYLPINTNGVSPLRLFHQFRELVSNTHTSKLPYYISKDQYLYTWVDLQPDGQLKSIYSGNLRNPQHFIQEDFEVIKKRFERFHEIVLFHNDFDKRWDKHIQSVANQHKFNAEHVVPQSWFQAKEPMKGDLHHLFACEPKCNKIRSNSPFYEYSKHERKIPQNDCGLFEMNRFEPNYGKGLVARATLYFLLRYPNKISKRFRKQINLSLLVRWHEQYSVTNYERHRNKAIYEIQGNRNPFIDFPDIIHNISIPMN